LVAGVSPVQWPAVSTTVGQIGVPEHRNLPASVVNRTTPTLVRHLIALPAGDRRGRLGGDHDKQQADEERCVSAPSSNSAHRKITRSMSAPATGATSHHTRMAWPASEVR
jgi:hypothetical protein